MISPSSPPSLPEYPILYKNKSSGKVSRWEIKIIPSPDFAPTSAKYEIHVTFGEVGGKQQTHKTIIEKGKSNRTVYQQSILEANSKWNEKKNRDGYSECADASSSSKKDKPITVFSPMLANTFNESLYITPGTSRSYTIPFPAFVQRKYDGIRCVAHLDNNVILESRKGVKFHHFPHIEFGLKLFFEQAGRILEWGGGEMSPPTNFYFDGELYCDSLSFETINGCVRLSKNISDEDRANIARIQYHIYDCHFGDSPTIVFGDRMKLLRKIFDAVRKEDDTGNVVKSIIEVSTETVNNIGELKARHAEYVSEGFEGIMIRDSRGVYEPNKRSKYLQKYKEFMEEEFEIVGFHDGEGVDRELVIWDCVTKEGNAFAVRPRATFEERKKLFREGASYIGKQLTVIFQEYSPDLIPRFPVGKAIRENM